VGQEPVGESVPQLGDDPVPVGIADSHRGRTVRRLASKCPHSQQYPARSGRAQAEGSYGAGTWAESGATSPIGVCSGKWQAAR